MVEQSTASARSGASTCQRMMEKGLCGDAVAVAPMILNSQHRN
jgi:hypothetical protein